MHAGGADTSAHSLRNHIAGQTGVLPDNHEVLVAIGFKITGGCSSNGHGSFAIHWIAIGHAANTIGAE